MITDRILRSLIPCLLPRPAKFSFLARSFVISALIILLVTSYLLWPPINPKYLVCLHKCTLFQSTNIFSAPWCSDIEQTEMRRRVNIVMLMLLVKSNKLFIEIVSFKSSGQMIVRLGRYILV